MKAAAVEVFKIFLANPVKSYEVKNVLVKNRDILISYFDNESTKSEENSVINVNLDLMSQIKDIRIEE